MKIVPRTLSSMAMILNATISSGLARFKNHFADARLATIATMEDILNNKRERRVALDSDLEIITDIENQSPIRKLAGRLIEKKMKPRPRIVDASDLIGVSEGNSPSTS